MENHYQLVAKTFAGLEHVLAHELMALGAQDIQVHNRSVSFTGNLALLYKANYYCRTALRILVEVQRFKVTGQVSLYQGIRTIDWSNYLRLDQTFAVDSTQNQSPFNNTMFISLKVKDAIVDQFRDNYGKRPNVDKEFPQLRVMIHIFKDECTVLLDSSGSSLHKRGYRINQVQAPVNEVLAAGLLLLSGWDKQTPLIDGMTGSGTIAIEASLLAKNVPAGYFRKEFGFENWIGFDRQLWNDIILEAEKNICPLPTSVIGLDNNRMAVKIARENVKEAGLRGELEILNEDFFSYVPPFNQGVVFLNPPYYERIDAPEDALSFYKLIGDVLKKNYPNYTAWIISANTEALKHIGLKPSKKFSLQNGSLESKFNSYTLFKGSRKDFIVEKNKLQQ